MHEESAVPSIQPRKRVLPVALLALVAGCGGVEAGLEGPPEVPPIETIGAEPPASTPDAPPDVPSAVPKPEPVEPGPQVRPWFHRLGGPQDDAGLGLAVDGRGNVSLVWLSTPREDEDREAVPGERRALSLARYAPDGRGLWTREFPRLRVASPRVGASPGGELFLTGNAFLHAVDFGLGAATDGFLVKFSEAGQALWQRRVGQRVYGLAADGEGGALVAAEEGTPDGPVPVLAHHDAQGAYRWTRQLDRVQEGTRLHALALAPSGRVLLAGRLVGPLTVDGRRFGAEGGRGLVLLAFGKDGRLAWGKEVRGVEGHVSGLAVGPEGGVVLVGEFRGSLPWSGTSLAGPGAFVLAAGPEGAEHWGHLLACGARPAPPAVAVEGRRVVAACGGVLSAYTADGAQRDQRTLPPGACAEGGCPVTSTALGFIPGQGLTLAGYQRHGGAQAGAAWDQEAFLRLLVP